MQSSTRRITVAIALLVIIFSIAIMECSGNPNPEQHETGDVANTIRYLQDLERIARPRQYSEHDDDSPYNHALLLVLEMYLDTLDRKHARTPRFGKRGNTYLNKEYVDYNILRYLLQNPELIQKESES